MGLSYLSFAREIWFYPSDGYAIRMSDEELPLQATVLVEPGVCRLPSTIMARSDGVNVEFEVLHSDCPQVRNLNKVLKRMEIWDVMRMPFSENGVYLVCGEVLKHSSCPVPMAMVKAAEVASEMAIKKPVSVTFTD